MCEGACMCACVCECTDGAHVCACIYVHGVRGRLRGQMCPQAYACVGVCEYVGVGVPVGNYLCACVCVSACARLCARRGCVCVVYV